MNVKRALLKQPTGGVLIKSGMRIGELVNISRYPRYLLCACLFSDWTVSTDGLLPGGAMLSAHWPQIR